jgi:hypothetical protein
VSAADDVRKKIASFTATQGRTPKVLRVSAALLARVRSEGGAQPSGAVYVDGVKLESDAPAKPAKPATTATPASAVPRPAAKPPAKPKVAAVPTCAMRRLDWGGNLAAEQVRLLTEAIDARVLLQDAPHAIACRTCRAGANKPCIRLAPAPGSR